MPDEREGRIDACLAALDEAVQATRCVAAVAREYQGRLVADRCHPLNRAAIAALEGQYQQGRLAARRCVKSARRFMASLEEDGELTDELRDRFGAAVARLMALSEGIEFHTESLRPSGA